MIEVDIIGGLVEWLRERGLQVKRGSSWRGVEASHLTIGRKHGLVTLIYPGRVPPGLQYDYPGRDKHGLLYCRKEWDSIYDPGIFEEVLNTARALKNHQPVKWHKFFRLKPKSDHIVRVKDPSWPPTFF